MASRLGGGNCPPRRQRMVQRWQQQRGEEEEKDNDNFSARKDEEKEEMDPEQEGKKQVKKILLPKEILTDQFIIDFIHQLDKEEENEKTEDNKGKGNKNDDANDETGELAGQRKMARAHQKISQFSIVLAHRIAPIIKNYLSLKQNQRLDDFFPSVVVDPQPSEDMAEKYRLCFETFIGASDCVSFATLNTALLGDLEPVDVFFMTLWAMVTCRRMPSDNLLQLVCSGASSSGNYHLVVFFFCCCCCCLEIFS
jgi:hypothetical protein